MATVRTRFAPSPTGALHIGNIRTALFNWLFARRMGGSFILRIEDTDAARSRFEHELSICEDLKWLGMEWDEGPDRGGEYGPYRQSERTAIHRAAASRLVSEGRAYRCYCTKEQLEALKAAQTSSGLPPRYDGRCRDLAPGAVPQGTPFTVRFRVPAQDVLIPDRVHGLVSFDTRSVGDFVIVGSDGVAAYNFAAAVDDAMMGVTHVIRGDDHLSNTPRQVLVLASLGLEAPEYAHIPLVLGPDRTPLSKRHGAFSVNDVRQAGFLPEAVVNAVSRLGWNPGEGLKTMDELAEGFSIERLSPSPSVFDIEGLRAANREAIRRSPVERLVELSSLSTVGAPDEAARTVEAVRPSASSLAEVKSLAMPFLTEPAPGPDVAAELAEPSAKAVIRAFREAMEAAGKADAESYRAILEAVKESTGEKGRRLLLPLRLALTGEREGIELARVVELLGPERSIGRLKRHE